MNLCEFSVKRAVTTLMIFFAVILVGTFCLVQTPLDMLPEMDVPVITLITTYEGAGPQDVEEKITRPLEQALATVEDLDHMVSTSREGSSRITLSFTWQAELDSRMNDVRDTVDMVQMLLPDEAERPRIFKFDVSRFPVLVYGVLASSSFENLEEILDEQVANPLESIAGVASVDIMVPLRRQVNVELDRERLACHSLTPGDVAYAIATENREVSAGSIKMGYTDYLPRVPGEFESVEPMNDIVVTVRDGTVVRIKDLGTVSEGFKDLSAHITINGKRGGILMVSKQSDANTVAVVRAVKERLVELEKRLPPDVRLVNVMDGSEDILRMVRNLAQTLLIGGGLPSSRCSFSCVRSEAPLSSP